MGHIPLIGTGLAGLVGSKFVATYQKKYDCLNLDISSAQPTDITQLDQVERALATSPAQFVVHCAAFTDVTAAWQQKDQTNGLAYRVNVLGTQNVVKACRKTGKHLIHLSTAYVFDGEQQTPYSEESEPHPIEWYGQTKLLAEEAIRSGDIKWTILRIDQPFRSDSFPKIDIAHRILQGLQSGTLYPQFTNHWFGPTFIDDFVRVIDWVIRTGTTGLFHATANEQWSDYDFATLIKNTYHLSSEVKKGDLTQYLQTVQRPYQKNTALDSSRLFALLDFKMRTITEAVQQVNG